MSEELKEVDVNEAFEDLLFAEDLAEKAAYEEGFAAGQKQTLEGYHLGLHRASAVAAQLGYFFGVVLYIQKISENNTKIIEQAKKLQEEIKHFPTHNDDSVDIFDRFQTIKLNFKRICSLAKIDPTYPEANKLEF